MRLKCKYYIYISHTAVEKFFSFILSRSLFLSLCIKKVSEWYAIWLYWNEYTRQMQAQLKRYTRNKNKMKKKMQKKEYTHFSPIKFSDGGGAAKFSQICVCFFFSLSLFLCLASHSCWCRCFCFCYVSCKYIRIYIECRICLSDFLLYRLRVFRS